MKILWKLKVNCVRCRPIRVSASVHPTTMRAGPVSESVDLLNDILVLCTGIAYIDDDLLGLGDEAASDKTELTARRNVLLGALDHKKLSLLCMEAIS